MDYNRMAAIGITSKITRKWGNMEVKRTSRGPFYIIWSDYNLYGKKPL